MSRVDFYVLPADARRDRYACSIANKAWQNGYRVYIQTENTEDASHLDDLMWTFHDISFIPHALAGTEPANETPVLIGCNQPPETCQVLINLTREIPAGPGTLERIVEIVSNDETDRSQARERYRRYRQDGIEVNHHIIEQV